MIERNRPTPAGRALGAALVHLTAPAIAQLARDGEPDARCRSCAFRADTVPNSCLQTTLDALKCAIENVPFSCHVDDTQRCYGWYAARVALHGTTRTMPWDFSLDMMEDGG